MEKMVNIKIFALMFLLLFLPLFVGCFGAPPTNHAPTIISTPITTATVGALYTYDVEATDPDSGDTLTYSLTVSPTGMTINSTTGEIDWTPNSGQAGDNNVTVKVSDGDLFDIQSFIITVNLSCVADKPTVITNDVSNMGETTATANGNITATGGENCTVRGFQYGLTQTATWNVHSSGSFGTGSYNMNLSGLTCESTYYVRAYATNSAGTSYGEWKSFTTTGCPFFPPTVVTNDVSGIGDTSATANGNITATGGENCTVRGFQYGESPTATWDVHSSDSFGTGSYSENLPGLTPCTKYYVRAYATNSAGTSYGEWKSFTTTGCPFFPPTVVTNDVSGIGDTSATANGNITATGGENCTVRGFQYGESPTATWDVHSSDSFGTGSYSENLPGLTPCTKYYVRAYAANSAGTGYGEWKSFTTTGCPITPNLKLTPATQSVTVGNQGTVNVVVEDVTNLMGADITLNFDDSILKYDSSAPGSFWSPEGLLVFSPLATGGSVNIQLSAEVANAKSGSGTIITVTFERIASGVTDICFGSTDLRDEAWQVITHTKGGCCSFTE